MTYNTSFGFDSIVVVESLRPPDLRSGRDLFETTLVPARAADPSLVCDFYDASDRRTFLSVLDSIHATARMYGSSPIIHLEAHGNSSGIQLSDGDFVSWADIAPRLAAVNETTRMNLLVVAAMCHGWHMSSVLRPTDRAPAFGIVATEDDLGAGDLLTVMQAFYATLLQPAHDLRTALEVANAGSPIQDWRFVMVGAELLLCRVFAHYVRSFGNHEERDKRVARMVAEIARARGLDVTQTMRLRLELSQVVDDHARWFEFYRTRFLMLDLFPGNAPRFPLRYADCRGDAA